MTVRELLGDENYENMRDILDRVFGGESLTVTDEMTLPPGRLRLLRTFVPDRAEDGTVRGFYILVQDLTELMQLEEQLQRSQRIEAVGRLTGGVAHDFNNMLSVIIGNIDLAMERLDGNADLASYLESAIGAATRSTELTQSLLAFSRQQALKPEAIDPAGLMERMTTMLRRVFDENIAIECTGKKGLWRCHADAAQLESALLNLSINARDAMPSGGTLRISAENTDLTADDVAGLEEVVAGEYVAISVKDNGAGIPPDVLEQVFDPFFTTKGVGEGSGLGLSMVYGFVRQSGGHVQLSSVEGEGTTVTLFLPRDLSCDQPLAGGSERAASGGGERLLVVEDDSEVRSIVVDQLEGLGYVVTAACDAVDALRVIRSDAAVDLLFTDVVMPGGMDGVELIDAAREVRPGLRVALTTGYSDEVVRRGGLDVDDIVLIRKPYKRHQLAKAVFEALSR